MARSTKQEKPVMAKTDKPIIVSHLDDDVYKLYMQQLAWRHFRDTPTRFAFKNRTTSVPLTRFIDLGQLQEELCHGRTVRYNKNELTFLREHRVDGRKIFQDDYIDEYLRSFRLPEFVLKRDGDQIRFEVAAPWPEASKWEMPFLYTVSELYNRALMAQASSTRNAVVEEGYRRLHKKFDILSRYPRIRYSDFCTRRRFDRDWQSIAIEETLLTIPHQFVGTSNMFFAKEFDIPAIGTCAHEYFQIIAGILDDGTDESVRASQKEALRLWDREYAPELSIGLMDTYGRSAFFEDFIEFAPRWNGVRQDSGDPKDIFEDTLALYKRCGVDPREKSIVFSDSLDVKTIADLHCYVDGRMKDGYGWGTLFGSDLGFPHISIVVKAVEACGNGLVKLSDNLAKAIGELADIERYKRIFGYQSSFNQECKC